MSAHAYTYIYKGVHICISRYKKVYQGHMSEKASSAGLGLFRFARKDD